MPQTLYCWRCGTDMPMLDEAEWTLVNEQLKAALQSIKSYRQEHGVALDAVPNYEQRFAIALRLYEDLTGFHETNPNALYHHRLSLYGPPCKACGKPLRTPRATFCAACGASA